MNSPDTIPHLSSQPSQTPQTNNAAGLGTPNLHPTPSQGQSGSPVKEPSVLQRGMSVDEQDGSEVSNEVGQAEAESEDTKGVPIRQ